MSEETSGNRENANRTGYIFNDPDGTEIIQTWNVVSGRSVREPITLTKPGGSVQTLPPEMYMVADTGNMGIAIVDDNIYDDSKGGMRVQPPYKMLYELREARRAFGSLNTLYKVLEDKELEIQKLKTINSATETAIETAEGIIKEDQDKIDELSERTRHLEQEVEDVRHPTLKNYREISDQLSEAMQSCIDVSVKIDTDKVEAVNARIQARRQTELAENRVATVEYNAKREADRLQNEVRNLQGRLTAREGTTMADRERKLRKQLRRLYNVQVTDENMALLMEIFA